MRYRIYTYLFAGFMPKERVLFTSRFKFVTKLAGNFFKKRGVEPLFLGYSDSKIPSDCIVPWTSYADDPLSKVGDLDGRCDALKVDQDVMTGASFAPTAPIDEIPESQIVKEVDRRVQIHSIQNEAERDLEKRLENFKTSGKKTDGGLIIP